MTPRALGRGRRLVWQPRFATHQISHRIRQRSYTQLFKGALSLPLAFLLELSSLFLPSIF